MSMFKFLFSILLGSFFSIALLGQGPLQLVPLDEVTHTVTTSGEWTSSATWGGSVPNDFSRIHIPEGKTLIVNGVIATQIKTIRVDGTLEFTTEVNTGINVESIVGTMGSSILLGTEAEPLPADKSAFIKFIDLGPLDLDQDFAQFGKGLITMGSCKMYGSPKSSWIPLNGGASASTDAITLKTAPLAWQEGDEIVITGTVYNNPKTDEKRSVAGLDGKNISLDQSLNSDHIPLNSDLEVHVANLSRNINIFSEHSVISKRGHVMFMHTHDVDMQYVKFYQLGRTDKRVQLDDWYFPTLVADEFEGGDRTNIRGRYSCHFHRGGVDPANGSPARIKGCVVEDDPGWAYVNHSSNVDFIDNVSYNIMGGAFQTEAGDEIGSFHHNIAIRTVNPNYPILDPETEPVDIREGSQDFAFQGDGFWFHGGGVSITENVASGCSGHGFIFWTEGLREVNTEFDLQNMFKVSNIPNGNLLGNLENIQSWWIPVKAFKDNTAYSASKGFASYYVHATLFEDITELTDAYLEKVHSTFENTTIWNVRKYGLELHNCERFTFKNLRLYNGGDPEVVGVYNTITVARESNWEDCIVEGFGVGMIPAMQGDVQICGGSYSNRWDFQLVPPQRDSRAPGWDRDLRIDGVQFVPSEYFDEEDQVRFKMEGASSLEGEIGFIEHDFQHRFFMIPDRIMVNVDGLENMRLFYNAQQPDYIPITEDNLFEAEGSFINDVEGRTNQELKNDFNLSFAGNLMPNDATDHPFVDGGKISSLDPATPLPVCHFIDEALLEANSYDDFDWYACWDDASAKTNGTDSPNSFTCNGISNSDVIAKSNKQFLLYPNPASDQFWIKGVEGDHIIEVMDINGKVLIYSVIENESINISSLSDGIYVVRLSNSKMEQLGTMLLAKLSN
jgi:hypothetical protein